MYTEGIKVGDNSYILSDEDGVLTLLNSKGTPEEIEEYINLKNTYEEERDDFSSFQNELSHITSQDRFARDINLFSALIVPFLVVSSLLISGHLDLPIIIVLTAVFDGFALSMKLSLCGTKKSRTKQKEEINTKLTNQEEKLKDLEKQINKLKRNIETESLFWEDEIIPVTTEENKKANVKMRVLKLEQNR